MLLNKPGWHVVMHGIAGLRRHEWFCFGNLDVAVWCGVVIDDMG